MILPLDFDITRHAIERFVERIIGRDSYTKDDIDVAEIIMRNILSRRAFKTRGIDQSQKLLLYKNAAFVYDLDTITIITTYPDENAKEKVEWIYRFPATLKFEKIVGNKHKVKMITSGFVPLYREGRMLIGQVDGNRFRYDLKLNYIKPV